MIELAHIDCFLAVVEEESFTGAARRLGLTQSAISQKLMRLEDQLGLHLVDRTSRSVRISEQGERFLPYARRLIEAEQIAWVAAHKIAAETSGTIRLGSYSFLFEERMRLVQAVHAHHPDLRFEIHHGNRGDLLEKLARDEIDAMLCVSLPGQTNAHHHDVFLQRRYGHIAVPPSHPLAAAHEIDLDQFAGERFAISPGRDETATLNWVYDYLQKSGIVPVPAPEADRRSIAQFAKMNGMPFLRWHGQPRVRYERDDEVVLPVRNSKLFTDLHVLLPRNATSALQQSLRDALEMIAPDLIWEGEDTGIPGRLCLAFSEIDD